MTTPKLRLWVLDYGLFPRQVNIYFQEKGIADKFDTVNVNITKDGMEQPEGKPPGTLPILELSRPKDSKPGRYIFRSAAILEYLEDVYGSDGPDMRGSTPETRARVRECMNAVNETTTLFVTYVQNGSSLYAAMRQQKIGAAEEAFERMHQSLSLLEKLADPNSRFLVGASPSIADCILMATNQFAEAVYGVSLVGQHPRLKKVVEAFDERGTAVMPQLPEALQQEGEKMHVK